MSQVYSGYFTVLPTEEEEQLRFILHPYDCSAHNIDMPHWVEVSTGIPFTSYHKNLFSIVNQRRKIWGR